MAEPDIFDLIKAGRDALRHTQQSLGRYMLPLDQQKAVAEGMVDLIFPGDRVRAVSDLIDAFGPPIAQIETLRAELAETREQLDRLDDRLAKMEAMTTRLASAADQVRLLQEPFVRAAGLFGLTNLHKTDVADADEDLSDEDDLDEDEDEFD